MNLKLLLFEMNNVKWNAFAKRYRIAVIDVDISKSYPANYICMLPVDFWNDSRNPSIFSKIFEDKSTEIAKQLLTDALEVTTDVETKEEIERRLKKLNMRSAKQAPCIYQGTINPGDPNRQLPSFK